MYYYFPSAEGFLRRGLGIAVVHEILALGTDVRLIQSLLKFNETRNMNVNEIPKELKEKIRISFDTNKDVMLLRTAQQDAQSKGDFRKALYIAQQLDELWVICLNNYMRKIEADGKQIDLKTADMPESDKEELMGCVMMLFMCCDVIESATIKMNDVLHRTNKDASVVMFEDLRQTLSLATEKLKYLRDKGDYMKDLVWADTCDNVYTLIQNKANSIIRKRKESKNWGKNMKKFYKQDN